MPLSNFVPRGFGFAHHSIAFLYHQVPNPNITIRNFSIAVWQVVAKLERIGALRNFNSILAVADAIILSRACLGLDVPVEKIALIQKMVLMKCNLAGKPVIITRVMDSMTSNPRPTRAEATDVANIVLDGADGILLGAETLRGENCALAVRTILSICKEAEKVFPYDDHFRKVMDLVEAEDVMTPSEALASSAVRSSMKCGASMIIVFTETGTTARLLSKYRPAVPILSIIIPHLKTKKLKWVRRGSGHRVVGGGLIHVLTKVLWNVAGARGRRRGAQVPYLPGRVSGACTCNPSPRPPCHPPPLRVW